MSDIPSVNLKLFYGGVEKQTVLNQDCDVNALRSKVKYAYQGKIIDDFIIVVSLKDGTLRLFNSGQTFMTQIQQKDVTLYIREPNSQIRIHLPDGTVIEKQIQIISHVADILKEVCDKDLDVHQSFSYNLYQDLTKDPIESKLSFAELDPKVHDFYFGRMFWFSSIITLKTPYLQKIVDLNFLLARQRFESALFRDQYADSTTLYALLLVIDNPNGSKDVKSLIKEMKARKKNPLSNKKFAKGVIQMYETMKAMSPSDAKYLFLGNILKNCGCINPVWAVQNLNSTEMLDMFISDKNLFVYKQANKQQLFEIGISRIPKVRKEKDLPQIHIFFTPEGLNTQEQLKQWTFIFHRPIFFQRCWIEYLTILSELEKVQKNTQAHLQRRNTVTPGLTRTIGVEKPKFSSNNLSLVNFERPVPQSPTIVDISPIEPIQMKQANGFNLEPLKGEPSGISIYQRPIVRALQSYLVTKDITPVIELIEQVPLTVAEKERLIDLVQDGFDDLSKGEKFNMVVKVLIETVMEVMNPLDAFRTTAYIRNGIQNIVERSRSTKDIEDELSEFPIDFSMTISSFVKGDFLSPPLAHFLLPILSVKNPERREEFMACDADYFALVNCSMGIIRAMQEAQIIPESQVFEVPLQSDQCINSAFVESLLSVFKEGLDRIQKDESLTHILLSRTNDPNISIQTMTRVCQDLERFVYFAKSPLFKYLSAIYYQNQNAFVQPKDMQEVQKMCKVAFDISNTLIGMKAEHHANLGRRIAAMADTFMLCTKSELDELNKTQIFEEFVEVLEQGIEVLKDSTSIAQYFNNEGIEGFLLQKLWDLGGNISKCLPLLQVSSLSKSDKYGQFMAYFKEIDSFLRESNFDIDESELEKIVGTFEAFSFSVVSFLAENPEIEKVKQMMCHIGKRFLSLLDPKLSEEEKQKRVASIRNQLRPLPAVFQNSENALDTFINQKKADSHSFTSFIRFQVPNIERPIYMLRQIHDLASTMKLG